MGTKGNGGTVLPQHTNGNRPANSYDDGTEVAGSGTFDFNSSVSDAIGSTAMAVLAAGDMISFTTDMGRNSVHVRIFSDEGNFDKWFNTAEALVYRLDRLYDAAVAKRNRKYPPTLPTT